MRHALIAGSLVAHFVLVAWLIWPERLEQVRDFPPETVSFMFPPPHCLDVVWVEHRSGCVVTRQPLCRWSVEARRVVQDEIKRRYAVRDDVDAR